MAYPAHGAPLVRGRLFTEQDDGRAALVAVVNQSMAARCWQGDDPIDKRVRIWGEWRRVVGVVGDVRSQSPAIAPWSDNARRWRASVPPGP